jgi:hypothetical protein
MRYFDRTNRLSKILITSSVISFIISIVVLFKDSIVDQVFEFSNGNYVKGGIVFTIWFLISVVTFIIGISLRCIVKDVKEELDAIKKVFNEKSIL